MGSPLQEKSKAFALRIIKVCNEVRQQKRESVLTGQLLRSGTSIGANIREAFYAHGRADFVAKLQIALKECSESEYWLELLIEMRFVKDIFCNKCIDLHFNGCISIGSFDVYSAVKVDWLIYNEFLSNSAESPENTFAASPSPCKYHRNHAVT